MGKLFAIDPLKLGMCTYTTQTSSLVHKIVILAAYKFVAGRGF